jgi:hypothetical protein
VLVVSGKGDLHTKFWQGNLGLDGWIFMEDGGREWRGFIWLSVEASGGLFWEGNELSVSTICREFLC